MASLTKFYQTPIFKRRSSANSRRCVHYTDWDSRFPFSHRDPERIAEYRASSPVVGSGESQPKGRFGNISVDGKERPRSKLELDSQAKLALESSYLNDLKNTIFLTDMKNFDEPIDVSIDVGKVSPPRIKYVDTPMLHPGAVRIDRQRGRTPGLPMRPQTRLNKVGFEKDGEDFKKINIAGKSTRPNTSSDSSSRPATALGLAQKRGANKNRISFGIRSNSLRSSSNNSKAPRVGSTSPAPITNPIDQCYS
jgi:hypothetical protein